ncbi:unnamed protein product [Clonostachys byssicola]|uniref:Enoyl reductase (ER) domain-containing protein n=1 Tax=Clonostachys byssicola TaxID=160290 RepID=A0A9N9U8N7_9HYPO|nr:unnamed protein product [Clonostachys byssicola]
MSSETTMQAWQFQAPGPLQSTLKLNPSAPRPSPSSLTPGQVLIKPIAAGLNPADFKVQELGLIARAIASFPKTAGMDLSGTVQSVGPNVTTLRAGDTVVGRVNPFKAPGALASLVVADAVGLARLPEGMDPVEVAGLPTGALTAYQTIAPHVREGRGDRVLINGATGGVGIFSVQVAKLLGCRVTATASTGRGVELAKELGADNVIDYRQTDVVAHLKGKGDEYDLIVDNVGDGPGDLFSSSRTYLGLGKPYVFAGGRMTMRSVFNLITAAVVPTALGGVKGRLVTFVTKESADDLERLLKWKAEGKLHIVIDSTFEFKDAKVAFEHLKAGGVKGKVIVKASPDQ